MVVEQCYDPEPDPWDLSGPMIPQDIQVLRDLRSVHRRFRDLRFIDSKMFAAISFRVEPEELEQLGRSLGRMGPFIQRIHLRPSFGICHIDFLRFADIEDNIMVEQIRDAMDDGSMDEAFTGLVSRMPNLCRIHPDDVRRDRTSSKVSSSGNFLDRDRRLFMGPFREDILWLSLSSVSDASIRLKELAFALTTDRDLAWTNMPWLDVDLSELEELWIDIAFMEHRSGRPRPDSAQAEKFMVSQFQGRNT